MSIILNTIVLTLDWYLMPTEISNVVKIINIVFAGIFTVEAVIKIIAQGKEYFRESWNIFDFIVVIATLIGILLDLTTSVQTGGKTTLIRAFRVIRVFRIIKRFHFLKIIIDTLIITLPSLANVGGLLLLILYVYSILGTHLYSGIMLKDDLNENANF